MKRYFVLALIAIGCNSQREIASPKKVTGDTRTKPLLYLNENTFLLTEIETDKTYGYQQANPINVGGVAEKSGPINERRFLNALLGPNGEELTYYRAGSCCAFRTQNGTLENLGLLDRYMIVAKGSTDTIALYLNMYDNGDLKVPVGFTAKKY